MRFDINARDNPAMIILNEKLPPPPSYATSTSSSADGPPPFMQRRAVPKLDHLPANLLLYIVNSMFPTSAVDATHHRRTLYWLAMSLRLVSRGLYIGDLLDVIHDNVSAKHHFHIACMHTLRSAYLASYTQLVKAPYTSDPFPAVSQAASTSPVLHSGNRETRVLDLYIALKVREDVWMDETELHLEREESFKDLFDLMQVRHTNGDMFLYYSTFPQ